MYEKNQPSRTKIFFKTRIFQKFLIELKLKNNSEKNNEKNAVNSEIIIQPN